MVVVVEAVTITFNNKSFMTPPESTFGGFNSVSKDSFLIFINGLEAEHESWSIEESGNNIVVTVNETKINFTMEIVMKYFYMENIR